MGEYLAEYSRALIRLHQRIEGVASTVAERQAFAVLGDGALKHQFVVGVRDEWVRHELRRLMLRSADKPFIVVRGEALCLMCEEEARVVQMQPVEKVASVLSGPVGNSVSCVLGLDAVVLGDGGVSSGDVGRCVSVGDVSVSCGGDMELCGVDTVLSSAVSGGLCDLDRVSGGGDTDMGSVDTMVSDAVSGCLCDIDSVSRGDLVLRVGEMTLSGGGDVVVSGVVEPVCGVSSVMTAGELDVFGYDSAVSDETGEVVSVGDVVACGDDPLLPDAVRVGGRLSVVGDTLVCRAGVARSSGRGDTKAVVGPGVAQGGLVDGLICADSSLRPEPPPMHAMCLCRIF